MKITDLINESRINSIPAYGVKKPPVRTIGLSEDMLEDLQIICGHEKINGARYLIENVMQIFIDSYIKTKGANVGHE